MIRSNYGDVLARLGQWQEALAPFAKSGNDIQDQYNCAQFAIALHHTGRTAEAQRAAREIEAMPQTPQGAYALAVYYELVGSRVRALSFLRRAVQLGIWDTWWIMNEPDLRSLHGDPEFQDLVAGLTKRAEEGRP